MRTVDSLAGLRAALAGDRQVGFVATMGNLHEGHLALVREARKRIGAEGIVAVSIFVNRLQFGVGEDFDRYPRTFDRDSRLLREAGCDLLFAPGETAMYPEAQTFQVVPDPALADILEGAIRSGHFAGMCTVVMKLFIMVRPTVTVFGMKDYQQLMLIRHLTRQFALPLQVVAHPIVRESDGLAMSSRNNYLTETERAEAPNLNRVLRELLESVRVMRTGRRPRPADVQLGSVLSVTGAPAPDTPRIEEVESLEAAATRELAARGWQIDYLTVRRQGDLLVPNDAELAGAEPLVVLAAARIGTPRLLDNIEV